MCALPARRIASSALCAALLVGITGPVAMAADSARGHGHVTTDVRLSSVDVRLAQIRKLNWGELTPVADLLNAALRDRNGRLHAAEARKLGTAAKAALAEAAAKAAESPAPSTDPAPGTGVLLPAPVLPATEPTAAELRAAELVSDLLDAVLDAVDDLLDEITSDETTSDADDVLPSVDDLLTDVDDLITALTGGDLLQKLSILSTSSTTSSATSSATSSTTSSSTPSTSASTPSAAAVTPPGAKPPAPVLLPTP